MRRSRHRLIAITRQRQRRPRNPRQERLWFRMRRKGPDWYLNLALSGRLPIGRA